MHPVANFIAQFMWCICLPCPYASWYLPCVSFGRSIPRISGDDGGPLGIHSTTTATLEPPWLWFCIFTPPVSDLPPPRHILVVQGRSKYHNNYSDAIMGAVASQITSLTIVYSTVYSGADQRKRQSSGSRVFVRWIPRWIPRTNGQ